jgi:hypothetical protein
LYRIYLTNFGYFLDYSADTLEAAIARAKTVGFEVQVYRGSHQVASYSPLGGLRTY